MHRRCDYLIIGAGIIGVNIAREIKNQHPNSIIIIIDKENEFAFHSSGRNSGVLHAGFYYKPESLKAKFTMLGNRALTNYCDTNGLAINKCGKVVVTQNELELDTLEELFQRGKTNDSDIVMVDKQELNELEPYAKTYEKAIYSPHTSTVNPKQIMLHMIDSLKLCEGIDIIAGDGYKSLINSSTVLTSKGMTIEAGFIINTAGLYADKIAKDFGFSKKYVIIPFKGIYLKYTGSDIKIKRNIYPVPNISNPFLGVHFTVTADQIIKIGPTAIPVFWREGYKRFDNFKFNEFLSTLFWESKLLLKNSFNFRELAIEEMKKYNRQHLLGLASNMVTNLNLDKFDTWSIPGIRAQLLHKETLELVQDFVIEGDKNSVHVLNAVSPGFTCSIPFSKWIVDNYIK